MSEVFKAIDKRLGLESAPLLERFSGELAEAGFGIGDVVTNKDGTFKITGHLFRINPWAAPKCLRVSLHGVKKRKKCGTFGETEHYISDYRLLRPGE